VGGNFTTLILFENFNFSGRTLQLTGPAPDLRAFNFDRACACRATGTSAGALTIAVIAPRSPAPSTPTGSGTIASPRRART